ncbi:MAG: septum site-determining protein MinC, partial [Firmicutes bacterium]|nr:septum site-determining protein MinC [Bacillota bacterium]
MWYPPVEPSTPTLGRGVATVPRQGTGEKAGRLGAGGRDVPQRENQPADEPEVLEGLARDIVSRLAATLFADEEPGAPGAPQEAVSGASAGSEPRGAEVIGPEGPARASRRFLPLNVGVVAGRRVRSGLDLRPALLVRGTVRSGQQVRHRGDVVVLGDVNPGGQVVAAGDVVVMGTLRGTVHAGATGDAEAVVAAFRLRPTQLRIACYVARPPEEAGGCPDYPEIALVQEGTVVVRPLTTGLL